MAIDPARLVQSPDKRPGELLAEALASAKATARAFERLADALPMAGTCLGEFAERTARELHELSSEAADCQWYDRHGSYDGWGARAPAVMLEPEQ